MTRLLQLEWRTETLDLLSDEGSGWRATGWNPSVAMVQYQLSPEPVTEKIDAVVDCDSAESLIAAIQQMGEMARMASTYVRDETTDEPVYLRAQMDDESSRYAVVRSIEYELLSPPISATGHITENRAKVRLSITRDPYWETHSYTEDDDDISTVGGELSYTILRGDAPARLWRTYLHGVSGSGELDTFWLGIRSENKHGAYGISNFESVWDCEDGSNLTGGDCADTADGDAHGGTMVKCDFATASGWHERWRLEVNDVTASYSNQAGRYLMLLRCRVTSGTAEILALTGLVWFGHYHRQNVVEIDDTDYVYKEIGVIEIPCNFSFMYGVDLWARRTAGSGDLYMDCIVMIPIDEGFAKFEDGEVVSGGGIIEARVEERNHPVVYPNYPFVMTNWALPPGDGMFVAAAQRTSLQDLDDEFGIEVQCYPRILSMRRY